ncbi:hypothetical protein SI65_06335 [Aspergillus cristatus]|uniref:Uncharacterized protein n=1 Tax=Aspergillus cristatus TaxID=573508 RepID=A0A1E3BBZ9_ASPCR|nr:hypothetical protein SI65_06335 [Aspergillus cristatus]
MAGDNNKTYVSNGEVLGGPPVSVRISRFFESVYVFFGLYFTSLLSFDPYTAAQNSQFNVARRGDRLGGSSGSGAGGPGGPGGPGPRIGRVGRVDDIRGPECAPCRGGC